MIEVASWIEQGSRGSRGSFWLAECVVDGRTFTARSRNGAPNELARQLVAAGIADQPMQTLDVLSGMKQLFYRSFYEAAKWTYTEGNRPLQRIRWEAYPENVDAGLSGKPQNRGESEFQVDRHGEGRE